MIHSQIGYIQECFKKAAQRAKQAGFDAVEIHTAHGYLIHQFLSPLNNRRSDQYGGSLTNRSRFALETLSRVREGVGDEFPIFCRVSADELVEGGSSLAEAKVFAKLLEQEGADVIDVSVGVLESAERTVPPMAVEHGCNIGLAEEIKRHINLPVICVGTDKKSGRSRTNFTEKKRRFSRHGTRPDCRPRASPKSESGRQHPVMHRLQSRVY